MIQKFKSVWDQKELRVANGRGILFQEDNARPHITRITSAQIEEFVWTKFVYTPYLTDLASSDYNLFGSLKHYLDYTIFHSRYVVHSTVKDF